jgi:pimeloyl-ACP methyl ester carboxylesterase
VFQIAPRRLVVGVVVAGVIGTLAARDLTSAASPEASPPVLSAVRHVLVDGMQMGYRIGGKGPALVMIIGRSATMAEWDPRLIGRLLTGHRVIVFDNRGVATSGSPSKATLTIGQMARDTLALMTELQIGRADVLGWSMGGMIAQKVALDAPSRVVRLVLCATTPGGSHAHEPSRRVQKVLENPHLPTVALFTLSFPPDQAGVGGAAAHGYAVATQKDLLPDSFTISPAARANQEKATAQWKSPNGGDYNELPSIKVPTLVLWGRLDLLEPPYNDRLIVRRIPHARGRSFGNAGHAFLFQYPAAVAKVINRFLR